MELYHTWKRISQELRALDRRMYGSRPMQTFRPSRIAEVWFWAVLNSRPTCWACVAYNWPIWSRRFQLPKQPAMSRRLRDPEVVALLERFERERRPPDDATAGPAPPAPEGAIDANPRPSPDAGGTGESPAESEVEVAFIDSTPIPISPVSRDRQAGYGYSCGSTMAKGYRLHAIVRGGRILSWRLTPMQTSEKEIARRMLCGLVLGGWLVGDSGYDSNPLHALLEGRMTARLLAPRKESSQGGGLGHGRHTEGRLRSIRMTEGEDASERERASGMLRSRTAIERFFSAIECAAGGLATLPAWVRGYRRVRMWVLGKLAAHQMQLRP